MIFHCYKAIVVSSLFSAFKFTDRSTATPPTRIGALSRNALSDPRAPRDTRATGREVIQ